MPKIYKKTILLTIILTLLFLNQLCILKYSHPLSFKSFLLFTIVLVCAIIINEKLTRGERWGSEHYLLLAIITLVISLLLALI